MKTLIIGNGEIGRSLGAVLDEKYLVFIRDLEEIEVEGIEVLHICFPYGEYFIKQVIEYKEQYKPTYTIIHSTVPVGTSAKCGAYHSPVRGIHPNLKTALKTFVKYLAPRDEILANYFNGAGINIEQVEKTESTELAKILSTTKYGIDILFNKEAHRLCEESGADFEMVYTHWTETYNQGYTKLGQPQFVRPVLKYIEGKIGGHCVIQNCKLLKSWVTDLIKEKNNET
jgi:hypothetical protein